MISVRSQKVAITISREYFVFVDENVRFIFQRCNFVERGPFSAVSKATSVKKPWCSVLFCPRFGAPRAQPSPRKYTCAEQLPSPLDHLSEEGCWATRRATWAAARRKMCGRLEEFGISRSPKFRVKKSIGSSCGTLQIGFVSFVKSTKSVDIVE